MIDGKIERLAETSVVLNPMTADTLARLGDRHGVDLATVVDRLLDYGLTTLPPDRIVAMLKGGSS